MMDIYNDGIHVDPDAHESDKVQKLVRTYLFNGLKFCTGEGRPSNSSETAFHGGPLFNGQIALWR